MSKAVLTPQATAEARMASRGDDGNSHEVGF